MVSEDNSLTKLNREMLQMVDFTNPFWNAGTRYWLEHRGPKLGRELANNRGLKLWLQVGPTHYPDAILKIASLFADQIIVGHTGPLPGYHLGLAFPWRLDNSTEIPPPPSSHGKPVMYPMRIDAVRRPLPPNSKYFFFGPPRRAIELGIVTYFPASIIYAPLSGKSWPSPVEVLSREGNLPTGHRLLGVKKTPKNQESNQTEKKFGQMRIREDGLIEFEGVSIYEKWEYIGQATKWEMAFSSLISTGGMLMGGTEVPQVSKMPDAIFRLNLPYIQDAKWDVIYQIRNEEKKTMVAFRERILEVCSEVPEAVGSSSYIKRLQKEINDGVDEVDKSYKQVKRGITGKKIASGLGIISLEIACFIGLPPLAAIISGVSGAVAVGLNLKLDLKKEIEAWKQQISDKQPMYFLWRFQDKKI